MKGFFRQLALFAVVTLTVVACKKDENTGSIQFASSALYFAQLGDKATISFTLDNIASVTITAKPTGWDSPVVDIAAKTLTITAPQTLDIDGGTVVASGTIVLTGVPNGGGTVASASLFVSVSKTVDLVGVANSHIVSERNTSYTFNPVVAGVKSSDIASVAVIWQSAATLIEYLSLDSRKRVSFFVGENEDKNKIKAGNAVIGAYNAGGDLLWSWHIWASDFNPENGVLTLENGFEMMGRNLGALDNDNSTHELTLNSYGLYYQWGRKDPFINPSTYQASSGSSAAMYNGAGGRVYMAVESSSAEVGTENYAMLHPLTFIAGIEDSKFDWLNAPNDKLWDAVKTNNDPCPFGWKVAPTAAFDGLQIVGIGTDVADKFGWTLGDGVGEWLFIGAGRRVYLNGSVQNVYNPLPVRAVEAQPWVGHYWSSNTIAKNTSASLFFWYNKAENNGGIESNTPHYRANGMSVRCVRE